MQAEVEALRKKVKQLEDELKNDDLKVRSTATSPPHVSRV
jgi:hypothetical protein